MKIAVTLNEDNSINYINDTNEDIAIKQSKYAGWHLVDVNSAFVKQEKYLWTIRQSDNKLVHISTGMTPDEESTQANALLGKNVGIALAQSNTANTTAQNALDIANKSVAANAEIGKLIAPLLAAQQNTSNTTTGGTN